MTSPYPLTEREVVRAADLIKEAKDSVAVAIACLRDYYALTKDDSAFRIIHALEARHSRNGTCQDVAFNLDDLRNHMLPPNEAKDA